VEVDKARLTGRKPQFRKGDIVYGYLRPYLNKVWIAEFDGLCSVDQYVFEVNAALADVEFIAWFMRSPTYLRRAPIDTTPGQLPRIRTEEVAGVEIELPPLAEQRRIAAWLREQLAEVACARAAVQSQLGAAQALPAALRRDVFGCQSVQECQSKPFAELVNSFDGQRVPLKQSDRDKREGPFAYYGASGIIDYVDDFLFDGEYLLIAEDGANLLSRSSSIAFRASGKFWVNNHAHVVQPRNDVLIGWLEQYLESIDLERFVTGSAQPKLSQANLNMIPIPVPSLEVQNALVGGLIDELETAAQFTQSLCQKLDSIGSLPAALLAQAFRTPHQ
jgi:type I restriction enzyme S subunit